ncbi:MAG TPA: hypothetical protein VLA89_15220 [Gemmatimonadales bacterium]|nr:hypothetical protein [Gemmatimonadales bacterium]
MHEAPRSFMYTGGKRWEPKFQRKEKYYTHNDPDFDEKYRARRDLKVNAHKYDIVDVHPGGKETVAEGTGKWWTEQYHRPEGQQPRTKMQHFTNAMAARDRYGIQIGEEGHPVAASQDLGGGYRREWRRREAGQQPSLSEGEREDPRINSAVEVYRAHQKASEAEHWAGQPYASPEQASEAQRLRHEANVAHVEHADRFGSESAHEAAQQGEAGWHSKLTELDEARRKSSFTEAKPKMFFREAEPKMFFDPNKEAPKFTNWQTAQWNT